MKQFIAVIILFLSLRNYSQTLLKSQTTVGANLEQYMWSYSKNKAASKKPLIDFDVMDNLHGLGRYLSVSDDGNYFAYTINKIEFNESAFGLYATDSLVIQSTKNGQRTVFARLQPGYFSADNRQYIFDDGGTLCFLQLGDVHVRKIPGVASYKNAQNKWLAYQLKDKEGLTLVDITTGRQKQFDAVADYSFSKNGEWLICKIKTKELALYNLVTNVERRFPSVDGYLLAENGTGLLIKTDGDNKKELLFVLLPGGKVKTIWSGNEKADVGIYRIDATGKQIVFTVIENGDVANGEIWYYKPGMDKAALKVTLKKFGTQRGLTINNLSFSDNGNYIQLGIHAATETPGEPNRDIAGVEVWSQKDVNLQSIQQAQIKGTKAYSAIVDIETGKLVFMESDDKKLSKIKGDFAVVKKDYTDLLGDRFWQKRKDSCWLVSLRDGSYHLLPTKSRQFWFSTDQKWLVYLDAETGFHYFSYELNTGSVKDISANVPKNQFGIQDRFSDRKPTAGNLAAWIEKDGNVLVYDNYDIWKLDLTGKQPAVNITNGFGLSTNTIFNLFTSGRYDGEIPTIKAVDPLILRGFNTISKQSGFYKKDGIKAGSPEELYLGKYFINTVTDWHDANLNFWDGDVAPLKAKSANTWILQRQSTNDAPNYYETKDFKNFNRLTDFQPLKNYQWFTEEVVSFKHLDGTNSQGILYKPENFDPHKKYPVLIPFYSGFSNNMYQFHAPTYIDQSMAPGKSPVWFLNNGFLVFAPDVGFPSFKSGPKAFSCIEGAAKFLMQLPYVDANKLAFASHSARAQKGAYLFTHSTSFAAAALTEGVAIGNVINLALSYNMNKVGSYWLNVAEEQRGGGNFWENKADWLDETTVLNADKANAPLLLLSDKNAKNSEDQVGQIFTSLRRLEKNVWWLKYDNGGHTLADQKELKDYTIRYTQFFDHYLNNAPAPQWMTEGIPYKLKGIESRYELDPRGTCNSASGEPCPICQAWNAQYKKTPEMFKKEIKDWVLDKDIADELERTQNERRKQLDKEGAVRTKEVLQMLNAK